MVQINFAQKEIQCKIVYYGPGMSGKTTNLELVHGKVPASSRGELTSIATTGERTLYFDYMPLDLGQIAGIRTKFQLYTVPGQIYYKSTRRLVLQGVDGIVFVADSSAAKLQENKESLQDLEDNLKEMGKSITDIPVVIQYNKRDLPDAMSVEDLEREINQWNFPHHEAIAPRGEGVFPTLKNLAGRVLESVNKGGLTAARPRPSPKAATVAPAPAPAAAPPAPVSAPPAPKPAPTVPAPQAAPAPSPAPAAPVQPARPAAPAPQRAAATAVAERPAAAAPAPARPAPAARPKAAPRPVPARSAAPRAAAMQDRVVKVSGLRGPSAIGKWPVILLLGGVIAGVIYFLLQRI